MTIIVFLRTLGRYLRPYWLQTALLCVLILVDVVFTTAWPLGFKEIIDAALPDRNQRLLLLILTVLFAGVLVAAVASLVRDRSLGTIVAFHAVFLTISASVGGLAFIMPVVLESPPHRRFPV